MRSDNISYGIGYAGAESEYNDADVVIYGIPYDHTSCFKAGAREAPTAIRRASYNFEEIHFEHGLNQPRLEICDYGNCDDFILPEDMFAEVDFAVGPDIRDGKFTIAIGGEHSINIPIVRNFEKDDIALISIDAHLDSRDEYLGSPNSHACITRRAAEHLGIDNVYVLGCRAIGEEELDRDDVIPFISSYDIMDKGIEWAIETALESVKNERVYLTVDIRTWNRYPRTLRTPPDGCQKGHKQDRRQAGRIRCRGGMSPCGSCGNNLNPCRQVHQRGHRRPWQEPQKLILYR